MIITIIVLIIPLFSSFLIIKDKLITKTIVREYLIDVFSDEFDYFNIADIEIEKINSSNVKLKSTIKLLENTDLTNVLKKIDNDLSV